MKKFILFTVLGTLISFIIYTDFPQKEQVVKTTKAGLNPIKQQASQEVIKPQEAVSLEDEIKKLPSFEDIESHFKSSPTSSLKSYLVSHEQHLKAQNTLEKANLGVLNIRERIALAWTLRQLTVVKKILLERELEDLEREGS